MTIPDAAIEAAAEALYASFLKTTQPASRPSWPTLFEWAREEWRTDTRAALEAAMPLIREHIAQEIDHAAQRPRPVPLKPAAVRGLRLAARIVRGGTP
jgi:hypothetical protein